jgi:hypothetical protein
MHITETIKKRESLINNSFYANSHFPTNNSMLHCNINSCMFDSIRTCCFCKRNVCIHHSSYINNTDVIICNLCNRNPNYEDIIMKMEIYYNKPSLIEYYIAKLFEFIKLEWLKTHII